MIKRLKAVYPNTGLGVTASQAESLRVPHGDSASLIVSVGSDDGTILDVNAGTLEFRLLHTIGGQVLYRSSVTGAAGSYETVVPVALPSSIPAGFYHWDLWYTPLAGTAHQVIPLGGFQFHSSSR